MKILHACLIAGLISSSASAAVKSDDITLHDAKRNKDLECRVHYPEAGDKLPLIVFSHGFGANKTAFAAISQHVAASGYVIVHPSHNDGIGRGRSKQAATGANASGSNYDSNEVPRKGAFGGFGAAKGGGLAGLMNDPAKTEGRVADIILVMDEIEQLYVKVPALKGRIDTSRIGVGGHSFGAYTAMLIGGVTADIGNQKARSFADPRVRCILPVSGQGTGQQGLTEASWSNLKLPMMTYTGSRDQGAGGQGPDWKKEPYKFSPSGDKYLVFIEGANHVSFGGFGGRESDITQAVKATSLAFWDAYLKGDEKAKASLKSGEIVKAFSGSTIESK